MSEEFIDGMIWGVIVGWMSVLAVTICIEQYFASRKRK